MLIHFSYSGDGTCKHIAALLFGLQTFVQGLTDRSDIGVTDKLAKWTNPVRSSRPVKITQLDLRAEPNNDTPAKPTGQFYTPVHVPEEQVAADNNDIEKKVYKLMKNEKLHACAAYTLSDSSESEYEFEKSAHDNVFDVAKGFIATESTITDKSCDKFVDVLKTYYEKSVCEQICDLTVSQSNCDDWYYQRLGRITASNVHTCLHFTGRNENGSLIKQILGQNSMSNINVASLNHGKKCESKAREMYIEQQRKCHRNFSCKLSGFVISNQVPFIGASPDGVVECECCGEGCIEIKCPYSHAEKSASEAACLDLKNFEVVEGVPHLKQNESSAYFCQIQCQLAVTKRDWCDLVVYTHSGIFTQRIAFDADMWEKFTERLFVFYRKYVFPKIMQTCTL